MGTGNRRRSEADELEADVAAAEVRLEEAQRVERAEQRLAELAGGPAVVRSGGPPAGAGLTRERIVTKVRELLGPGVSGEDPTQPNVASALGVTDRYVRQVGGAWTAILADARKDPGSG
jgi:hypothetical protein